MNNKLDNRLSANSILGGQGCVKGNMQHEFGASFPQLLTFYSNCWRPLAAEHNINLAFSFVGLG